MFVMKLTFGDQKKVDQYNKQSSCVLGRPLLSFLVTKLYAVACGAFGVIWGTE